jgi:hypothetical protein
MREAKKSDIIITQQMMCDQEAVRVPVMIQRSVATLLADFTVSRGSHTYDTTIEEVILKGIAAINRDMNI